MTTSTKLIVSLHLLAGAISGQSNVSGTLTDAATGEPIAQGNIVVLGTAQGDAADDLGRYFIANLPEGRITLVFSAMGFETEGRTLTMRSSPVTFDVALQPMILEVDPLIVVRDRVGMIGDPINLFAIPGAAHIISRAEMRKQSPTDIHRILQQVPGINIQEEDGFGLRPNIGMRGTGVERSQKIALMEDGVLIAPAPYSAPAAYYFPAVGRMERIEVRKGSSQIKYGPNTGGGALNMVSTSLPGPLSSHVNLSTGAFHARRAHIYAGASTGSVGWLVETYQHANDGFKVLDQGGHTGFRIADYLAKVRVTSRKGSVRYQTLEMKFGYTDEVSNETYLGLTEEDFRRNPARRYAASQKDRLEAQHWQVGLTHFVRWGRQADLT
ncbi:MAG: TonB-dependent receptor plug domain-containing protein, partial [Candidatus Neomarinimicrobiota bacterium]